MAFRQAAMLVISPGRELLGIIGLSLLVSGTAVCLASALGVGFASVLALSRRFPLRGAIMNIMNTFMGLPPVVVGLALYLLLSNSGPLGFLQLLYTPKAMILAQFVIAFPIVTAISHSAIVSIDPSISSAAKTLGATAVQHTWTLIREARFGIFSGIMAALGRVMAEVGAILIVGGNIKGFTRVMTTAIALETSQGDFELAIALGIVLITISLAVNSALFMIQKKGRRGFFYKS